MLQPTEQHTLERKIEIQPHLLGCNINKLVKDKAWRKVKNLCKMDIGFVMRIDDVTNIGDGKIDIDTGNVIYPVQFVVTTFRPKVGDTIPTQITEIGIDGFFSKLGPLQIYTPIKNIPYSYKFTFKEETQESAFICKNEDQENIERGSWHKIEICAIKKLNIEEAKEAEDPDYEYIGGKLMAIGKINSIHSNE